MGWFSETKTYVSSSAFNLAGDTEPPNLMSSVVVSSVLTGDSGSIADALKSSLLSSTSMMQRRFFTWAQTNYGLGMPTGYLGASLQVATTAIQGTMEALLGIAADETLQIMQAELDTAEVTYWAEAWMRDNHPNLIEEAWVSELDLAAGQIHIDRPVGERFSFAAPADLVWGLASPERKLLYVTYRIIENSGVQQDLQLWTYRIGSGTAALDKLDKAKTPHNEFFPVMPLRRHNLSIRDAAYNEDFAHVVEGFKKLYGRHNKIGDLLDQIEANEDIGEVDFCYLVPGVTLDTKDQAGKAYLYAFFQTMHAFQETQAVQDYNAQAVNSAAWDAAWSRWLGANDPVNPRIKSPVYGAPPPVGSYDAQATPSLSELVIDMEQLEEFALRLQWLSIDETEHVGNAKRFDGDLTRSRLKKGRYWINARKAPAAWATYKENVEKAQEVVEIFHQYEEFRYRKISILGLTHGNYIYSGKTVWTSGYDALTTAGESSFLLPLHAPTLKKIGLVRANQLSTSSSYLLFNHYKKVKLKWYQTKAFRWALVIASVGLAIATGGASLGASAGILGTNAAVGAAVGASAATAAIVGAAVNAIAGMIVASLITKASTSLFGEKWGTVIGTIASFVALQYGAQYASQGNFAVDWGQMMKADNLINVTSSVGKAYSQWINADTTQIYNEMGQLKEEYAEKLDEVDELSREILGMTGVPFDPMLLTDATEQFGELPQTFLNRTLLTGSDIAEMSLSMIEDFVDATLELPQAIR